LETRNWLEDDPPLTLPPQESSSDSSSEDDDEDEEDELSQQPLQYTQGTRQLAQDLVDFGRMNPVPAAAPPPQDRPLYQPINPLGQMQPPPDCPIDNDDPLSGFIDFSSIIDDLGLTEEEKCQLKAVDRGKNTKAYSNTKLSIENRFFRTLLDYGGHRLQAFLQKETMDHGSGPIGDYAFYRLLRGEKTPQKKKVLNAMLCLCGMKWYCLAGKDKGKRLQPNSFDKMMQLLSYIWKKKGILYNYKIDFNNKGEFHGVCINLWNEERKLDGSFGTNKNKARVDMSYVRKIVEALQNGTLDTDNPHHLQLLVSFILGYYCSLRGLQEHTELLLTQVVQDAVYLLEDGGEELAGLRYCGVTIPYHKANQLRLGNTSLPATSHKLHTIPEDAENQVFNPYAIMQKYFSHLHPEAIKFNAKIATASQRTAFKKAFNKDVWYCASHPNVSNYNLGKGKVSSNHKELARIIGIADFEKMTGHSLRVLSINTMKAAKVSGLDIAAHNRHRSINSQMNYGRETTAASEHNKYNALRPANGRAQRPPDIAAPVAPPPLTAAAISTLKSAPKMTTEQEQALIIQQLQAQLAKEKSKKRKKKKQRRSTSPPPSAYGYPGYPPHHHHSMPPPGMYAGYPHPPPPPYGFPLYGGYPPPHFNTGAYHGAGNAYNPFPHGNSFPPASQSSIESSEDDLSPSKLTHMLPPPPPGYGGHHR
jgi:hypothetical protein